jgi:Flp pilus assembly secretin CpaC
MSACSLSRRLTPAVLLLAATLAHAGPQADRPRCPAQTADTPALVTTVYQVADLVIPVAPAPGPRTQEEQLIRLLVNTVAPQSWDSRGGPGTVDYFPLTMSLAVRQSPAVQKQVAEVLASLRSAQDVEVALEVRFLCVSEALPGRAGLDFDAKEGVAFLDDKQMTALLEAAQGDPRTNVLQAPKLTLFNGQCSTLDVSEQKAYLTGVTFGQEDGQSMFRPITEVFTEGLRMTAQPVVSADRRFVRLSVGARLTSPDADEAALVPVTVSLPEKGDGEAKPVVFTQFLQGPKFTTLAVDRTVAIPAGHTAVLRCGTRTRSQGVECCPPVLSRVPYLNRLFKNVGQMHENETVLMMVTPHVIVVEETEEQPVVTRCAGPVSQGPAPCAGTAATCVKCEVPVSDRAKEVADLVASYHRACAEGRGAEAMAFAVKALALDPMCFSRCHY